MRIGLVVMRAQPLHFGHTRLIDAALDVCEHVFIILGSTQEHGTPRNPFSFGERKKMVKRYLMTKKMRIKAFLWKDELDWEKVTIIGLPDIFSLRWPSYVLEEIAAGFPEIKITDIFGGSQYDVDWFKAFNLEQHILDRTAADYPFVSASMLRDMLTYRDPKWMTYVPKCNWPLVARKFDCLDMVPEEDDKWNI